MRPEGRASIHALAHPEATMDLLRGANACWVLTGDAVTLCPRHGAGVAQ